MRTRSFWNLICVFLISLLLGTGLLISDIKKVSAQGEQVSIHASASDSPVVIYFFWGDGCPHCAEAEPFLESLVNSNSQIELKSYEVWYNADNQKLLQKMAAAFNFESSGVPTIFIGDSYWVGFSDSIQAQIEKKAESCLKTACPDAGAGVIPGVPLPSATEQSESTSTPETPSETDDFITLPIIGKVNLRTQSLIVSTIMIALVDGVNPCSLWVLSMLLALTLHTGSRKKIFTIGLVFITVTAFIYVLFITGLFSLLTYVKFMGWIQVVIAVIALFFAVINIKDYFFYKEGVSLTIPDSKKPGIMQKMRKVMDASQSVWGLIGATILLAGGVSLVEFSCTAGFPVLWTNLLTAQNVQTPQFILLLVIYMLIYQLDELVIFFTAVFTLKASKLEEKSGRILKLIGGMLMLTLAMVMLIDPTRMNSVGGTLIIFGIAFAATLGVLLLHRKILPAFGIWIGTEKQSRKKKKSHH